MSVPHAIKLHNEKGKDGFAAILIHSQDLDPSEYLGYMTQKFPKNRCMVVQQGGIQTDPPSNGIPHAALIGADGAVLWAGNPASAPKKIDTLIQEEIDKKIKPGWGKTADIKKVRALMYGKGDLAGAAAALEAAEKSAKQDQQDDVAAAKKELEVRYAARKKSVTALQEEGRWAEAHKNALALEKAVKGRQDWEAEVKTLLDAFKTPEGDKELKADMALNKMLAGVGEKAPGPDQAGGFRTFAKKNEGTKAAKRATEFAAACEYKPH